MRPIAHAVIRTGLIPDDMLTEIRKWGLPIDFVQSSQVLETPQAVVAVIQDALESADQVEMRDTDLDILTRFLDPAQQLRGTLVLRDKDQKGSADVTFCLTQLKEYAIPWTSESIFEMVLNGETYLRYTAADGSKMKVFFQSGRELFFGTKKAFMICEPKVA
jgi:hypothetical protein